MVKTVSRKTCIKNAKKIKENYCVIRMKESIMVSQRLINAKESWKLMRMFAFPIKIENENFSPGMITSD